MSEAVGTAKWEMRSGKRKAGYVTTSRVFTWAYDRGENDPCRIKGIDLGVDIPSGI